MAVWLVVLFHVGLPVPGGFVGVDIFFVISGFVITAMMVRNLERDGRLSLREFYGRRVRRLLPAVALMVTIVAVVSFFLLSPFGTQQRAAKTGIASSFFFSNGLLFRGAGYFATSSDTEPLLHTWSLAVEEQFYLFFPAVLLTSWLVAVRVLRRPPRKVAGAVLAIGGLGSFGLSLWMTHAQQRLAFYSSPTRAWEFSAGALLALFAPSLLKMSTRAAALIGAMGFALIGYSVLKITGAMAFPGAIALVPVVGTSLIIAAGTATSGGTARLLSLRPLSWIGDISYGWYLWHWPAIVFAGMVWPGNKGALAAAATAALLPAYLSYRLVENPIRFNSKIRGRKLGMLAATCIILPVFACAGLLVIDEDGGDSAANLRSAARLHADELRGCKNSTPLQQGREPACTWAVPAPKGNVVLIGDSNAGQFTESVAEAANREGFDFTVATQSACPFVDLKTIRYDSPTFDSADCNRFVKGSVDALRQLKPSLVIISSSATGYLSNQKVHLSSSSGEVARTPEDKARLWAFGLGSVVSDLSHAEIPTVVVQTVPHFPGFDVRSCPKIYFSRAAEACGVSLSRSQIEAQQYLARSATEAATIGLPFVSVIDFTNDLCDAQSCSTTQGARWLYLDGNHLSVPGALTLTNRFADVIQLQAVPASS